MGLKTRFSKGFVFGKLGVYFSLDAFLAAFIIISGFILINSMVVSEQENSHISFFARDLLTAIDNIPVSSLNNSFVQDGISNGSINPDNSILEQIATFWALDDSSSAEYLSNLVFSDLIPSSWGARLSMSPDVLFEKSNFQSGGVVSARRMVSGVDKNKPIEGSSSYGYLRSIRDKRSSSYAYFGGFFGQGNFTVSLERIPLDVNSSRITGVLLEGDFKRNFSLFVNGFLCDNLSAFSTNMSAFSWNLTHCSNLFSGGNNNVSVFFDSLNNAYVGGGFIRVDYETDTFFEDENYTLTTYNFPEVSGIVNVYDAFFVPGSVDSMEVYLHYLVNNSNTSINTFYFTIGDAVVYSDDNSSGVVSYSIDDSVLSSLLNYSSLSNSTVPLRIGFENLTYSTEFIGRADVALVTDVSGSMDWNFTDSYSWGSPRRNCDDALINDLSTQRLSVAKCLDKDFIANILNVSGNFVGLVSYESSTDDTHILSTNISSLNNDVGVGVGSPAGYSAGGGTCICCGINDAVDLLVDNVVRTVFVPQNSVWNFSNNSFSGKIPVDSNNNSWFDIDYSLESSWSSLPAVLGHDAGGGGVAVDSEINSNLSGSSDFADLWELAVDLGSREVDFSSGLNSSANTYGLALPVDGWDWSGGTFDYISGFNSYGVVNNRLRLETSRSGNSDNSGSFAVSVNITQELYDILVNGSAIVSFDYWWHDHHNYFEYSDQVWVKARWTSPFSGGHLLGSQLDEGDSHGDSFVEVATSDNPDLNIVDDFFYQDISSWIEGPGVYYLELGGKLDRSASNEWGYFYFDNILLEVSNSTDHYFFRKHFQISDLSDVRRGFVNVLSDDIVKIYLNGNLIFDRGINYNGTYWDITGFDFSGSNFRVGDNVLAVELENNFGDAKFDLELVGVNDSQDKSMMVMTDGEANVECARQGWTEDLDGDGNTDTARDDAIQASCDAAEDWGITVYSVGFSDGADEPTLSGIASCGGGLYKKSSNTSELSVFYDDVVLNILEVSRQSQSILISQGNPSDSFLFGDSYISFSHSSDVVAPSQNEIELKFQSDKFNSCYPSVNIESGLRVSDAKITSYSGEHWTSLVLVDNITVFNLSVFGDNYTHLGDPFIVNIPASILSPGLHNISIFTGDDSSNTTGCSDNNSLIYSAFVNSSTSRSSVTPLADGCLWNVSFEDGYNQLFSVPSDYSGAKSCSYSNESISFDNRDSYDLAVYSLLSQLDFDSDGRVLVNLGAEDLEIIVTLVNEVPYLWGPAIVEVSLWQ